MRVLRLGLGDGRSIDLHPAVSVVSELSCRERRALRRGFSAIGFGLSPAPTALVEAHGLLLDATQEDLDLLDVAATAASTVTTAGDVPGALPDDDAQRLRSAEQDVVRLAAARAAWPQTDRDDEHDRPSARPDLAARAADLRARLARHEQRDDEGVRIALDHARDAERAHLTLDRADLVDALAGVGLDTADLGLPARELVRMAEDWLDERAREAAWAVGAHIELQGIERVADRGGPGTTPRTEVAPRPEQAHADAVAHVDDLRTQSIADHAPRPPLDALEAHLLARLGEHRPDRLAGAVPLVLDGVLAHLDDAAVARLLDRVAAAAGPVQLVVSDEHPAARAWAVAADVHRAAVVSPVVDDGSSASA